ncbi:MAG: HAMP domain-containing sensor histidine kinase [Eubacteriales bacterium]|nr:HAMP domain-containing sensor histidine kinase [Eubacteriales bacterium]
MKSIYLRSFAATAATVAMCFLIIALSFIGIGRSYVISESRENMVNTANEVGRMASAVVHGDSLSGWMLSMSISSIAKATGDHIFITDASGTVLSCSDRAPVCEHLGQQIPEDTLEAVSAGGFDERSDLGGMYPLPRYVVAVSVPAARDSDKPLGFVFVTNATDNMLGTWSTFLMMAAIVAVGVFCAALLVSLLYSKHMARPLDEMAAASRKFAKGDFSARVKQTDDPSSEMGMLIDSFNKMADSLEQSEKRRSEFIGNISHELRTPMTTIAGFADGILDGTIPPEEQNKYLCAIRDETKRLSRLVREMLSLSQTRARASDASRRTVFDLTELILQTLLSFEGRATKKNLDVDPQLPDNHILVRADKDAITQVIYNLLDNAVKFAEPGSCLVLKLYKERGKAFVSIKDYGETIPPDDLPFIFDRFHKSDRSRSLDKDGVGLGLYLVKTILTSHDEDIAVKSEDGATEFVFTLALAEQEK